MATDKWTGNGNWSNPDDWNPSGPPGTIDNAEILHGTSTIDATVGTVDTVTIDAGGTLDFQDGALTATGDLDDFGYLYVDDGYDFGGSTLDVGGTIDNTGAVDIGWNGLTADTTVTASGIDNTGSIRIEGNGDSGTIIRAALDIGSAAPSVLLGSVTLIGDALLAYTGGGIATIDGYLEIDGSEANLSNDGGVNSALTGLTDVAGTLALYGNNGASGATTVTTTGNLDVTGGVYVDDGYDFGGSTLDVGGTIDNSGAIDIGWSGLVADTTVSAAGLDNTGAIRIEGNYTSGTTVQAALDIGSAAPSVLLGSVTLIGDALLAYTGGGIATIDGYLEIDGSEANLSNGGGVNSALTGLTDVAGTLALYGNNGVSGATTVTTTGNLDVTGGVYVDDGYDFGGSTLDVGGTIDNSGAIDIGWSGLVADTTVSAAGLDNTGAIRIEGNYTSGTTVQAALDIGSAAPSVLLGSVTLIGDALLAYTGGGIATIDGYLEIDGSEANLSNGGGVNSALTGLTDVAGTLALYGNNGVSGATTVTTTGNLDVTGGVYVDDGYDFGGSTLDVGGTIDNSGAIDIGWSGLVAGTTVSAAGLDNTGAIGLTGSASYLAELTVNGNAVNAGTININSNSEIAVTGGDSFTQDGGTTNVTGTLAAATIDVDNGLVDFTAALTSGDGTGALDIGAGGTLEFGAAVDNSHTVTFAASTGTLELGAPGSFAGTIDGFSGNDVIDLLKTSATGVSYSSGTLTVTGSDGTVATLAVGGTYPSSSFTVTPDGNGGTDILLNAPDTVDAWTAESGNWSLSSNWSNGSAPGLTNNAVISASGGYTVSLTSGASVNAIDVVDPGATFSVSAAGDVVAVTTDLTNDGTTNVDNSDGGGTTVTIGGALVNNNTVNIGNTGISSAVSVTVAGTDGLVNTGYLRIEGNSNVLASLDVTTGTAGFGTAGVETGTVFLLNDALLEFASGQIATIDGTLSLDGAGAVVADAGDTTTNSALTGLANVDGNLLLQNGASVAVGGDLTIGGGGQIDLSDNVGGNGGDSLTVAGTLTNNSDSGNGFDVGDTAISSPDTVTVNGAGGLVNTGYLRIEGDSNVLASLDVTTGAAGFGTAGVETGTVFLQNDALLEFASGQIATIDGTLSFDGAGAVVADAGDTTTSSALTGLTNVDGNLYLQNGASVAVGGDLTIGGGGQIDLSDNVGGNGGDSLTVAGTLTNNSTTNNGLDVGDIGITSPDTVTVNGAGGLVNTGRINIEGNTGVAAILDVTNAAAGFGIAGVETGTVFLQNDALLEFASGQIATIDGTLSLDGAGAVVADAGGTTTNSALTGLTTVDGNLYLQNGASVAVGGDLTIGNGGQIDLSDNVGGYGGDSLTVAGTLTNNSTTNNGIDVGDIAISSPDTVTVNGAGGLVNTGRINIEGADNTVASVDVANAAAGFGIAGVETGTVFLQNDALLEFASGQIATIDGTLSFDGAGAVVADAGDTTTNSALTGLTTVDGNLYLQNGASVAVGGDLTIGGGGQIDLSNNTGGGNGGDSLTVAGTLTNNSSSGNGLDVGETEITSPDTVTVGALDNRGTINLQGASAANTGSLTVNGIADNYGTVNIDGNGDLTVTSGNAYTQALSGAVTTLNTAGILAAANIDIGGGLLQGDGTIDGNLNVTDSAPIGNPVFAGTVEADNPSNGNAAGTLTVDGNFDLSGATGAEAVEATLSNGSMNDLSVTGDVNLNGGTLVINGTLTPNTLYTVMNFTPGDLFGNFTAVQDGDYSGDGTSVNLGGGSTIQVFYNELAGTVQVEQVTTPVDIAYVWDAGSGSWDTAADWSPPDNGTTPTSNSDVTIAGTSGNDVTLSHDQTINSLTIDATNGLSVNSGTLTVGTNVTDNGTLDLSGGELNLVGTVTVGGGASLALSGGTVVDATLTGSGTLDTAAAQSGTLHAVTIASGTTYTGTDGSTTNLVGTIDNSGTISIDSTGDTTDLLIANGTTLDGGGTVLLSDSSDNRIYGVTNSGTETLTNVDNTIEGAGQFGAYSSIEFINEAGGTVNATGTIALTISPTTTTSTVTTSNGGGFVNRGLLEATGTGGLVLNGGTFNNKVGTIAANGGGDNVLLQSNVVVSGGTLTTSGGGLIETVTGQTGTLDGSNQGTLINKGTVAAADGSTLDLDGTIDNIGTISVDSTGDTTDLLIANGTTLDGGGTVLLSDSSDNRIFGITNSGTETLTNVDNTIEGAGQFGAYSSIEFINEAGGTVNATGTVALTISPTTIATATTPNGGGFVNRGLLEATGTGGLVLNGGTFNNKGGTITTKASGDNVSLEGNVVVSGGTLTTSGGGLIETVTGQTGTLDGYNQGTLINNGTVEAVDNSTLNLDGTIDNTGTISVDSTGDNTSLLIADGTTLDGGGTVLLSDNASNRIYGVANSGTETLTNVDNTIEGAGKFGIGNSIEFINEAGGTVNAIGTIALTISPTTTGTVTGPNGGGFVNRGLLEATGTGGLVLNGGTFNNKGGTIAATGGGDNVSLEGYVVVSGGTLTTSGGGLIETVGGQTGTLDGSNQGTLINNGTVAAVDNSTLNLDGTIDNTGTISVDSTGDDTDLRMADGTTLDGGGTVLLSDSSDNLIFGVVNNGTETVTNVDNTIEGAGQFGAGSSIEFINESGGTVNATGTIALTISPTTTTSTVTTSNGGGFVNRGLLEATGTGGLVLNGGTFNNKGGTIAANGSGDNVSLEGNVVVSGGTLTTSGGGLIETPASQTATLDGHSQGTLINDGTVEAVDNSTLNLDGTIDNIGTISVDSTGDDTDLRIADGTTLDGGGTVLLSDSSDNLIFGVANNGTETLTNVDNTIEGAGQFGIGSSIEFINQAGGIVDADAATNALVISPTTIGTVTTPNGGGFVNQGLLEATGTGGLVLNGGTFNNDGGTIAAKGSGDNVSLEGYVVVSGGTLTTSGGGLIETVASQTATLDGHSQGTLINDGTVEATDNSTLNLDGTIDNIGTISVDSTGDDTDLRIADGTTLDGGGTVLLSDDANNRIFGVANSGTETLTNVDNTIEGAGQFGVSNSIGLVNEGTIDATGVNALILAPTTSLPTGLDNTGVLIGSGAGGLKLTSGTIDNAGTIEALNGSSVTYSSAATDVNNSGGTLTGGVWEAIDGGGGAAVSITGGAVTTDDATIVLSGANSVFQAGNGNTFTTLDDSLTTIAPDGELDIDDGRTFTIAASLMDSGKLVLAGGTISGGSLTIGSTGTLTGYGTINDPTDNGTVTASGGTLDITGNLSGDGQLTIEPGAVLELGGTVAGGISIDFAAGDETLQLGDPGDMAGTIDGFASGDTIDLTNVTYVAGAEANLLPGNTLEISDNGTTYDLKLDPSQNFTGDYFHLASAGTNGGLDITESTAPCYCRGTLILTDRGEVAVEELAIGDLAVTVSGAARPIKWIGRRSYSGRFVLGNRDVLPVVIRAGAFADNVPQRDLWLSPEHALYLDAVLIPARHLVNDTSIVQVEAVDSVEYFHIELDSHDVILAEGAPAESFIDDGSRAMFHNMAEFQALYPDTERAPARYCAPRVEEGLALEGVRRWLLARGQLLDGAAMPAPALLLGRVESVDHGRIAGWAFDPAHPDMAVSLVVIANGTAIGRVVADRYRPDLADDDIGDGCHSFAWAIPGGLAPEGRYDIELRNEADGALLSGSPAALEPAVPPVPEPMRGQIESVTHTRIAGWAFDPARPQEPVALVVFDNGAVIGEIVADRFRSDLADDAVGDGRHSFDWAVPGGLAPDLYHEIELRNAVDGAPLSEAPVALEPEVPLSTLGELRGYLDVVSPTRISGWAQDGSDPDLPVGIVITANDKLLGRLLANRYRADLRDAGQGSGRHGFELLLPHGLTDPEAQRIQVRREADGADLPGSPIVLPAAGGFDRAMAQGLSGLLAGIGGEGEAERALEFLAEAADKLLGRLGERHGGRSEREAQRLFRRRWGGAADENAPSELRALFVDERVPNAARDAGSAAILSHMRALRALGYAVSFIAANAIDDRAALAQLAEAEGIAAYGAPYYSCIEDLLSRQAGCFDLIYLHRAAIAERYLGVARWHCSMARIVYSVADLHHIRFARQAKVEARPEVAAASRRLAAAEFSAAGRADLVLTHSPVEAEILRRAAGTRVHVVPFAVAPGRARRPFAERTGIAFVGSFGHAPNPDAAYHLVHDVLPLVWRRDPTLTCTIAGHGWRRDLLPGLDPRVEVAGAVADLDALFDRVRLSVAPLRFGAGIKGKVIDSFAAGLPCAMTPIAAEGIALPPALQPLVAPDAAALAELIVRLHSDAAFNRNTAAAAADLASREYSQSRVTQSLAQALTGRPAPVLVAEAQPAA